MNEINSKEVFAVRNREEAKRRAKELVAQMTVEEKASQLRYDAPAIPRLNVPAYNWWNEGLHAWSFSFSSQAAM